MDFTYLAMLCHMLFLYIFIIKISPFQSIFADPI
jgi:hypothetical protein